MLDDMDARGLEVVNYELRVIEFAVEEGKKNEVFDGVVGVLPETFGFAGKWISPADRTRVSGSFARCG